MLECPTCGTVGVDAGRGSGRRGSEEDRSFAQNYFSQEMAIMKWLTLTAAAFMVFVGGSQAEAGLFSRFGGPCGQQSCCHAIPSCAAPAPAPSCCAPAPAPAVAPSCCAPAPAVAPSCCAPVAPAPSCCAPVAPSCCQQSCCHKTRCCKAPRVRCCKAPKVRCCKAPRVRCCKVRHSCVAAPTCCAPVAPSCCGI